MRVPHLPIGHRDGPRYLIRYRLRPRVLESAGERMVVIHQSADVADGVRLGDGTAVWHLAQIREGARLGDNCTVGRGAYIGIGVRVGDNCKLQNFAMIFEPAILEDGVFVGPGAVLTNDKYPRSVSPEGRLKGADDWEAVGVTVRVGASVGAHAVCVGPVTIGRWAMVAAGAVVINDVADHVLVAGVPARRIGWVGRSGVPLTDAGGGLWLCPRTGERYLESAGRLVEAEDRE